MLSAEIECAGGDVDRLIALHGQDHLFVAAVGLPWSDSQARGGILRRTDVDAQVVAGPDGGAQ